jgi:hypothetical protein
MSNARAPGVTRDPESSFDFNRHIQITSARNGCIWMSTAPRMQWSCSYCPDQSLRVPSGFAEKRLGYSLGHPESVRFRPWPAGRAGREWYGSFGYRRPRAVGDCIKDEGDGVRTNARQRSQHALAYD